MEKDRFKETAILDTDAGQGAHGICWTVETWRNPQDESFVQSCTIIVTHANDFMKPIHHRMPVILSPDEYSRWLNPTTADGQALLHPCPSDWPTSSPVSTHVNSPENNDSQCIQPMKSEFDRQ